MSIDATEIAEYYPECGWVIKSCPEWTGAEVSFWMPLPELPRRCANCGKMFIPRSRSDEIYCDNPSPKNPAKTCKQYGKTTGSYENIRSDPVLRMCRNIYVAKQMLVRRNPDIQEYANNFDRFKREHTEWKRKYKSGECNAEEFTNWLTEQKGNRSQ